MGEQNSDRGQDVVQKTIELYDSLPQDKGTRMKCLDIRDRIIQLNYKFFGYVAANTYVDNTTYEDKFQTALMAFLGMWWKYRWGKWSPKERGGKLSFSSFFKQRLSEEVRRYLDPVSYSIKRSLCMKAAEQLGKHWASVSYDDLDSVKLPADEMSSLKVILGTPYPADLAEFEQYSEVPEYSPSLESYVTDRYDTVEEMLIQEMIQEESQLSNEQLLALSDLYSIDYREIKSAYERALIQLYERLTEDK